MSAGLNPAQREAVKTLSGPLLVLAGAGTGKTRVVTYRIAELIRSGIKPDRILAVTFTRKAAGEMQERALEILYPPRNGRKQKRPKDKPLPEISTFHSLCVRILRRHISKLGYPENFTIGDRGDQESQARAALREIRAPGETLKPADLLGYISRWKMRSIEPHDAASHAESDQEHLAAVAYRRYQNNLKKSATVDFDDLLFLTEELFKKHPEARREEAGRFDHVLVDEYQDTNHSQYEIVRGLTMGHRNLCVVGDDDQSIYAWRGAEVTHILSFRDDWPEAKIVRLEDNYRSRSPIIEAANTLIVHNSHRHEKVLRPFKDGGEKPRILQFKDEVTEAVEVVADIRMKMERTKLQPKEVAILFRTNEQPRVFEAELRAANLPYILIGGMSFYDRREVRDVMAFLKVINNPNDEPSLLRILNTPPRGIGDAARKHLVKAATADGITLWEAMKTSHHLRDLSNASCKGIEQLQQMVRYWQKQAQEVPLGQLVELVIDQARYHDELRRIYPDATERDARVAAIGEVVNAAVEFDNKRQKRSKDRTKYLAKFLDEIAVGGREDSEDKESQLKRNAIALMTMHAAKGLEFPHVYMVGMEETILPHKRSLDAGDASIDEERRLAYVGVTRAKERLTLSLALTRKKWGKSRDSLPSRFLFELTGQAERAPHRRPKARAGSKAGARRRR